MWEWILDNKNGIIVGFIPSLVTWIILVLRWFYKKLQYKKFEGEFTSYKKGEEQEGKVFGVVTIKVRGHILKIQSVRHLRNKTANGVVYIDTSKPKMGIGVYNHFEEDNYGTGKWELQLVNKNRIVADTSFVDQQGRTINRTYFWTR